MTRTPEPTRSAHGSAGPADPHQRPSDATRPSSAPDPGPAPQVVEWYRPDPRPDLARIFLRGGALLSIGLLFCIPLLGSLAASSPFAAGLTACTGLVFTALAPVYTAFGFHRLQQDDTCLVLRSDGLIHTRGQVSFALSWDDVMSAEVDDSGALRLTRRHHPPHLIEERFLGAAPAELARRISHVRRRALMGLIAA